MLSVLNILIININIWSEKLAMGIFLIEHIYCIKYTINKFSLHYYSEDTNSITLSGRIFKIL